MSHFNSFSSPSFQEGGIGFYRPTNPNFNPTQIFNPNFQPFDFGTTVYVIIEYNRYGDRLNFNLDKINLNELGKTLTLIGVYENLAEANLVKGSVQNRHILTTKLYKSMYKTPTIDPLFFNQPNQKILFNFGDNNNDIDMS